MALPLFEGPWPEGDYRFFQLGFVVDDLVDAARRWAAVFGVGPFHVLPAIDAAYSRHDTSGTIRIQVGVAQAGPVQIELIHQGCDTPSIFDDQRGKRGGFHQLCTITADYDGKLAHYRELGYDVATELHSPAQRVAFVDTLADFGFYTEVVDGPPAFVEAVTAIARTCADWDGTDPVRLLTRDGYRVP
jgi:Glyoxalase/Bleomycin resistance protein/Dioxygenase superfamily